MKLFSIVGTIVFFAVVALSLLAVIDILLFKSDKISIRKKNDSMRKVRERPMWSRK